MEITSSNFDQSLPVVERSIQTADFITFDTEFSGMFWPQTIFFLTILLLRVYRL
jgi:hypothetical protein